MGAWIVAVFGWLAGSGPAFVRRLASYVRELGRSLWHHIQAVSRLARQRFAQLRGALTQTYSTLNSWVNALYRSLVDIYNEYVPSFVRRAINNFRNWIVRHVNSLVNWLSGRINSARRWLSDRINQLQRYANGVLDWAARQLSNVRSFINGVVRGLQHVLGGPRRLADWLAGAMVDALWRYVRANETRIGRWARDRSLGATLWAAGRLESLIRRVL